MRPRGCVSRLCWLGSAAASNASVDACTLPDDDVAASWTLGPLLSACPGLMLVHDTACVPQVAHRRREECRCRHRPRVSALLCSSKASPRASGTDWVLGPQVLPDILELAQRVEHSWLAWASGRGEALSPVALDPRFHLVDGGAGDTHIRIQNVVYASSLFRRCHLELAAGSKGLSVLHCVMYPWAAFDLPLFSLDIVAFGVRAHACRCMIPSHWSGSIICLTTSACHLPHSAAGDAGHSGRVPLTARPRPAPCL